MQGEILETGQGGKKQRQEKASSSFMALHACTSKGGEQ